MFQEDKMLNFDKLQKTATAAVGALILTTACVSAAVGPARAAETSPVIASQLNA
jgi:hypothetical protein